MECLHNPMLHVHGIMKLEVCEDAQRKKKKRKCSMAWQPLVSGVTSLPLINALMKTKEDRMHPEPETGLSNSAYIWWIRKIFAATNSQGNELLCKLIWWLLGKVVQDLFKGCAWFQELLHLNVALPMGSSCGRMFLSHYSGSADCKWCYKAAISFHIDATHAFLQKVNFFYPAVKCQTTSPTLWQHNVS